ncbi:MAG: RHS repeat domain-containing protein [Dehalococcoidia bacterium]
MQATLGLYYMQARWMDPNAGIFLSIDPVVGDATDPQSVNAYARNNPASFTDPTGMFSYWDFSGEIPTLVTEADSGPSPSNGPGLSSPPGASSLGGSVSGGRGNGGSPAPAGSPDSPTEETSGEDPAVASASATGKSDPHGKNKKAIEEMERKLDNLRKDRKKINRTGSRAEKAAIRRNIMRLKRKIDQAKKGLTHHRGINPMMRGTYPWIIFDFQIRQIQKMLREPSLPPDTAKTTSGQTES